MKGLEKFYSVMAAINTFVGKVCGWIIFPMMVLVFFEVGMRYIFGAPTIWTWEFNTQLLMVMGALAAGYGLLTDSHVRVDVFSKLLPFRGRTILNVVTDILTVVVIAWLTWFLIKEAVSSTLSLEHSVTAWAPIVYPVRIIVAIGFILLTLQAICNLFKNVTSLFVRETPKKDVITSGAAS
ncbi:MAG: TRAP transporter small permease subunit [Syntrophales bacterium]|nr:TRAP transporter small permease subunit [Syntrophales bacterium]